MKKLFLFILSTLFAATAFCTDNKSVPPPKPPRGNFPPHQRFHKYHGTWMAFAELSAQERQDMLKLQREDPEKFRAKMQKLGEDFFKAEKKRRQELAELVEKHKKADEKDKAAILENIKKRVRDNFKRRLRQSRMQLDELQQRAERLEQELDRREKAEEKIVDSVVNNIISGKRNNFKRRRPHPGKFAAPPPAPLQAE